MASTPLSKLLGSSEALSRLQDHAKRLVRMQRTVDAAVPPFLKGHVQVANFADGRLTLHVASPAVATRLNLGLESLRSALYSAGEAVSEVKVKVRAVPFPNRTYAEQPPSRRIGSGGRDSLQALSERLSPDDPLAIALKKMVRSCA